MALNWLKTGEDSVALAKKQAIDAEIQKELIGKLFRFFLMEKEEARITFVDGDLDKQGFLVPPRWYEHNLFLNGKWFNYFICPEQTNPDAKDKCPIDETGDKPTLVAGFTVIDHRQFKGKNDKVYQNTRKILVAKPQSVELLNKHAVKRGGLAGTTWDVSRIGDKNSPSIGTLFDFVDKKPIEELKALYQKETTDPKTNTKSKSTYFLPADWESEIVYRTGDELRKMGLGKQTAAGGVGTTAPVTDPATGKPVDYSGML